MQDVAKQWGLLRRIAPARLFMHPRLRRPEVVADERTVGRPALHDG